MAVASRPGRKRHSRHTRFDRLRQAPAGDSRSKVDRDWRDRIAATLNGTAAGTAFTAAVSDVCTAAGHGYTEGEGPFLASTSDTLPGGLSTTTLYWIGVIDANTFNLHAGPNAEAAIASAAVDITDTGTGTHTLTKSETEEAAFHLRRQNGVEVTEAATDIDDLS